MASMPALFEDVGGWEPDFENFNMTPGTDVPIIHDFLDPRATVERELEAVNWGLVAAWKKTFKELPKPVNARIETVATNGMFRDAFRYRRCIVPASAYYEWVPPKGADGGSAPKGAKNIPFVVFTGDSAEPSEITGGLAFAGIYEDWIDQSVPPSDPMRVRRTMAIITRPAMAAPETIHDRMPAMLMPEHYDHWLGNSLGSADEAIELLHASTAQVAPSLRVHQVSDIRTTGFVLA
jgi:putative SOS response-associated peptidase YedK